MGRFAPGLPKISDGQQLFVLNGLAKLAPNGKMAIIQNGSPLFSGDAGSGPSNIRQYILENDWLDCIIQLSTDMFMNTGISTYIWILSKDKPDYRAGKVQLIDASHCFESRKKNIGTKRNDITDLCRELIVQAYGEYRHEVVYGDKNGIYCESKIFESVEFGYNKIVVERPLRYNFSCQEDRIYYLPIVFSDKKSCSWSWSKQEMNGKPMPPEMIQLKDDLLAVGSKIYLDEGEFVARIEPIIKNHNLSKLQIRALLYNVLAQNDSNGSIYHDTNGKMHPDVDLRDTENVPLTQDIDAYFEREVLPYAPDAWVDHKKTKVGYEIPMTRYFYEYQAPESIETIVERIKTLEADISASLDALFPKED